jgi:phenylacetate-CoA ligase
MNKTTASSKGNQLASPVLSVIAPCYNEQGNIRPLVERTLAVFDSLGITGQLVLIDDGSEDQTWDRIVEEAGRDERVLGVQHETNRGIVAGWQSGLTASDGELICLIDSDLQNRPEDIAQLYKMYLREIPDLVQGVRNPADGARRLHLFSRGLNALLNATFRMRLRDNKSGFVLCRRNDLSTILHHRYAYRYFQSFIGVAAGARGMTIAEVDTRFERRQSGQSFLSRLPILVSARIIFELLKFRLETWRSRSEIGNVERQKYGTRRCWTASPLIAEEAGGES